MEKTTTPQSLSSSVITKWSSATSCLLLLLLHVATVICSGFTFSSWPPIVWFLFIPYYILLWIASVLAVYHWHQNWKLEYQRKKDEMDAIKVLQEEDRKRKAEYFQIEREKLNTLDNITSQLLNNPNITEISFGSHPVLGENIQIKSDTVPKNLYFSHPPEKKNKQASSAYENKN